MFSHAVDQFKVDRKVVSEMFLHLEELLGEISKDWNRERPIIGEQQGSTSSAQTPDGVSNVSASNTLVDGGKSRELDDEGIKRGKSDAVSGTPSNVRKKITFKRTSPKSDLLSKIECNQCHRFYNSLKALKKHLKLKHGGAEVDKELKEVSHRITCRICQKKQTRDLMNRHIKESHGMTKPHNDSLLRGWFTLDDVLWKPLWLLPNEQDPPEEIMVPLNDDGTFTVYGFNFENKTDKSDEKSRYEKNSRDGSHDRESTNAELSKSKDDVLEENQEDQLDAIVIVQGRDAKELSDKDDQDHSHSVDDHRQAEEKNSSYSYIDANSNLVGESMSQGDLRDVEGTSMKEANEDPDVDNSAPCVGGNVEKEMLKCDLEEDLNVTKNTFQGQGSVIDKSPAVRNLFDTFCSYEEEEVNADLVTIKGSTEVQRQEKDVKVKVQVFNPHVAPGEFWSVEKEQFDSDFEENDTIEYTEKRRRMKEDRKLKRNDQDQEPKLTITNFENNRAVIEEFEKFMKNQKLDTTSTPSKLSTIRKAMSHLFNYPDSLLHFETALDPKFNLQRLLNPLDEDFLELADPTTVDGWFRAGSEESNPIRCRERLKHHAKFREFLIEKLRKAEFGKSAEAYYKKEMVIKNLGQISTNIKTKNLYQRLQKSEDNERIERERAREVLYPRNVHNEIVSVSKWYESDEGKAEEQACLKIYKSAVAKKGISSRDFTRFGQWGKFSVWLADKGRRSTYSFTNLEFKMKRPQWFPEDAVGEDYKKTPDDWDPNIPHEADAPATCWVIEVSGEGLKGGNKANLVLTRKSAEICEKYRDMKGEVFEDGEDDNSPFFVNLKKRPLTEIQRTPGSLLEKFGKVCGVNKATTNTLR